MRSTIVVLVVLLAAGVIAEMPAGIKEVRGLSLRGDGCHVELLSSDGSVICTAIAAHVPKCTPLMVSKIGLVPGAKLERWHLGSSCPLPRLASVDVGNGHFFIEVDEVVYNVVCDDASASVRNGFLSQIQRCCRQDKSIQGTPVCDVSQTDVVPPPEYDDAGHHDTKDGG